MYRNTVWRDFVSGYTENGRIPEIGRAVQYLGVGRILGINMHLVASAVGIHIILRHNV